MIRLRAYLRLLKIKRKKRSSLRQVNYAVNDTDDIILDFDLRPYLGWMEEELRED